MAEGLWNKLCLFHWLLQRNTFCCLCTCTYFSLFMHCEKLELMLKMWGLLYNIQNQTEVNKFEGEKKFLFIKPQWLSMEESKIISLICVELFSIHTKTWEELELLRLLHHLFWSTNANWNQSNVCLKSCVLRYYRSFF